ncbi:MAG: motif protein [Verrucomicrobiales bacterium]|nr:motif protein [Verrucomicrobiales bacterium]
MSPWKVILATLVIFTAGLFTGAVGVQYLSTPLARFRPGPDNPFQPWMLRDQFVKYLGNQMDLSPDQRERISAIVHDSQQRTQILTGLIEPEMREELRNTREAIRQVLTPAQREQYDEILKKRFRREKESSRNQGKPRGSGSESNRVWEGESQSLEK